MTDTDTRPRSAVLEAVRVQIAELRPRLEKMHELPADKRATLIEETFMNFEKLLYGTALLWNELAGLKVAVDIAGEMAAVLDTFQPERPDLPN